MFSINKKNYYVTQIIGIKLKIVKKCLINRIYLITDNQIMLRTSVYRLINNKKKINI